MEFSPKKTKNHSFCCVPQCNSRAYKCPTVRFHHFPKPGKMVQIKNKFEVDEIVDQRNVWQRKLLIGKRITNTMQVCSLHFCKDDYLFVGYTKKRYLKETAIPSQNLPKKQFATPEKKQKLREERKNRMLRRKLYKEFELIPRNESREDEMAHLCSMSHKNDRNSTSTSTNYEEPSATSENNVELSTDSLYLRNQITQKEIEAAESLMELLGGDRFFKKKEVGCQVNTVGTRTVCDLITTDAKLNSVTGIHSFTFLETIVKIATEELNDTRSRRLSVKQKVILTFMKLKTNLSYVILSLLFGEITSQTCRTIICKMFLVLAKILQCAIPFPSKEEILNNMPISFRDFQNVRVVLDCTEIEIQQPKCLCCRITTYSHYKGHHTVKFMSAVTPGGLISFISKPYGGRTSDKEIFIQSNLIKKLDMFVDHVLVDKGFLIDDICNSYGIKVIRPPFLKQKTQLSKEDALLNAKIAKARVHVERMYQRVKIFRLLSSKLPWNLVPYVECIFIIASAIANLSSPIMAKDKFIK